MDHGRLHEVERALADAQRVAGLHALDLDAVVRADLVHAGRSAGVDGRARRELVDLGQAAGVVHLHVVGDHDVDLRRIDHLADALNELVGEGRLSGIDERYLLVHDEIGVVGNAAFGGVAVELALVPVEPADPPNLRRDLNSVEHAAPFCCPRAALNA